MATTFGLRNRASTLLGLSLTGLLLLPTRVRAHDLSPDTLTLFGVGATGKATLSDPTGCTANLQVFIQDTNIVAVTPLSASSVVSQVFTVTALRVGSTVVRIDFAGDTPLCTEVGSKFLTVQSWSRLSSRNSPSARQPQLVQTSPSASRPLATCCATSGA